MRQRRLPAVVLLTVAVVAGFVYWKMLPGPEPHKVDTTTSDYTLENFELTTLSETGQESFSVEAPYLERDPQGKSLTMRLPRFSFPQSDGGRWLATADRAWVAEKGVEVRLIDKVEMTGPPTPRGERARFRTAQLNIFPKKNLATSADPVTITRSDSILQGTGLRADMHAHRIQLLADVKGRYAPPRR